MFFCHALVSFPCSFWLFLLNISPFEWYSKCWTSSLVIRICSFHVLLCMVGVLKPVWIGHVDKGRVVFHHFSHSSIKQKLCNLQKSMQQFMPLFLFEVPLTSVRLKYKWFVQSTLHQEISHCHVAMFPNVLHGAFHCLWCALSLCYVFFFGHGRTLVERVALESRYLSNVSFNLIERISTKDLACFLEYPCFFPMFILTLPS